MKVPPKRKGNPRRSDPQPNRGECLNESPSEKEGKSTAGRRSTGPANRCLNESPSEKEGKSWSRTMNSAAITASMKVPPKRKGNTAP